MVGVRPSQVQVSARAFVSTARAAPRRRCRGGVIMSKTLSDRPTRVTYAQLTGSSPSQATQSTHVRAIEQARPPHLGDQARVVVVRPEQHLVGAGSIRRPSGPGGSGSALGVTGGGSSAKNSASRWAGLEPAGEQGCRHVVAGPSTKRRAGTGGPRPGRSPTISSAVRRSAVAEEAGLVQVDMRRAGQGDEPDVRAGRRRSGSGAQHGFGMPAVGAPESGTSSDVRHGRRIRPPVSPPGRR